MYKLTEPHSSPEGGGNAPCSPTAANSDHRAVAMIQRNPEANTITIILFLFLDLDGKHHKIKKSFEG